jgi:hypothetical protein
MYHYLRLEKGVDAAGREQGGLDRETQEINERCHHLDRWRMSYNSWRMGDYSVFFPSVCSDFCFPLMHL